MAEFQNLGDSIEGAKVDIKTRKQIHQCMISIEGLGRCHKYKCQTNAKAEIVEELEPKLHKYKDTSHLDLNDCIRGDTIEVLSSNSIKFEPQGGYSHKHGIQEAHCTYYTFAEVMIPFRFILEKGLLLTTN